MPLPLPSADDSMSFENHSVKSEKESKSSGMMKCSSAHNSAIEFWIGVPVRSKRLRQLNPCERTLARVSVCTFVPVKLVN